MNEQECRRIVAARSGGICEVNVPERCRGRAESMHHRLKRSHGGNWVPSNVLHVCGSGTTGCHGHIEANPRWANTHGYWLMAGDGDPREVPVYLRWMSLMDWFLLDDTGCLEWTV